jgi:hypothetical protein
MPTDLFETRFVDCWVVKGSAGEYSDRNEWCIAVFLSEESARALITKLDLAMLKHKRDPYNDDYYDYRAQFVTEVNKEVGCVALHDNYNADESRFFVSKTIFGG